MDNTLGKESQAQSPLLAHLGALPQMPLYNPGFTLKPMNEKCPMSGVFSEWLGNHYACSAVYFFLHSDLRSKFANLSPKCNSDSKNMYLDSTETTAIEMHLVAPLPSC